jgi:HlyD family secretion protein
MNVKWRNRILWIALLAAVSVALRLTVFATKPIPIIAYVVKAGLVEDTVTNSKAGTVKTRKRASLSPETGGRVIYIGAREGQRVKAGDLLLRLQDTDVRASLTLAERALQSAEASMHEACMAADLAQRDVERNKPLKEQGIVPASALDRLENQWRMAQARCEAGQADTKRVQAAVEVARAALQKTELRAPFDGVVSQLHTEVGEFVTPSPPGLPIPPVIDLLDNENIYIEAPMDETDTGKLRLELPVRITLDPFPGQSFPGKLNRIAPFVLDVAGQSRTVDVEAEFNDQTFGTRLLPGTSADVEIILQSRDNVLRIPTYSLLEGNLVLLIQEGKLVKRPVKTGLRNWEFVEITDGLKNGDRIAASLERAEVKDGALVTVTSEAGN